LIGRIEKRTLEERRNAMPTETVTLTPDALLDLPALPDGKHYELSDGES
jgi:hypothetical protein